MNGQFSGGYVAPTHILAFLLPNDNQVLAPQCPSTALVMVSHGQTKTAFYQITGSPPAGQPSGALCEELDINGYPTETTFDSSSRLTTVTAYTDWNGSSFDASRYLTLAYSGSGTQIISVTSSVGTGTGQLKETYGYSSGELANATDADSNETRYSYNAEGVLRQILTPNQYAAASAGTYLWLDTSGRVAYSQDPAARALNVNPDTAYTYECSVSAGTCSTDGTQTTVIGDPLHTTDEIFVDGMMTAQTQGVGTSVQATTNYSYDQNTLGIATTTQPANGSGASYEISYTNWYGLTSGSYGNVQCSVAPGNPGSAYTITGASQSGGTATLTFSTTTAPVVGATIVVSGVGNTAYDGTFQVTAASTTSVSYLVSGSPGSSSGGSFYQIQGDVTSYTYNSFNQTVTTTNPLEQSISYSGACNSGTPTYTTTSYYGSAGSGTCSQNAPQPWLLACTVEQTGGTPASPTTNYGYDGTAYGSGTDNNTGDVTSTADANGNLTVTAYDTSGSVRDTYASGQASYVITVTGGSWASNQATLNFASGTTKPIAGTSITVSGMTPTGYDGTFTVVSSTSTSVTYSLTTNPGAVTADGSIVAIRAIAVTGASWSSGSGGQATLTFASTTAPFPGTQINVSGVSPSGYNGTFTIVSSSSTSVTYAKASNPGSYTSGGEINDLQDNQTDSTYEPDGQIATTTVPNGEASSAYKGTTTDTYDAAGNQTLADGPRHHRVHHRRLLHQQRGHAHLVHTPHQRTGRVVLYHRLRRLAVPVQRGQADNLVHDHLGQLLPDLPRQLPQRRLIPLHDRERLRRRRESEMDQGCPGGPDRLPVRSGWPAAVPVVQCAQSGRIQRDLQRQRGNHHSRQHVHAGPGRGHGVRPGRQSERL